MLNLTSNALKFCSRGGDSHTTGEVTLTVKQINSFQWDSNELSSNFMGGKCHETFENSKMQFEDDNTLPLRNNTDLSLLELADIINVNDTEIEKNQFLKGNYNFIFIIQLNRILRNFVIKINNSI